MWSQGFRSRGDRNLFRGRVRWLGAFGAVGNNNNADAACMDAVAGRETKNVAVDTHTCEHVLDSTLTTPLGAWKGLFVFRPHHSNIDPLVQGRDGCRDPGTGKVLG